jgi:excisionase family DNA binding protein
MAEKNKAQLQAPKEQREMPLALRVKDFCGQVGISPSTFWKYAGQGKIKVIRIGGRVLIPAAEVARLLSGGTK